MTTSDAAAILAHFDALGLQPLPAARGWAHMGAVLSDAALQPRAKYRSTVYPRVVELQQQWPNATTTTTFLEHTRAGDVAAVLRWRPTSRKIRTLLDLAGFLHDHGVETPKQLRQRLTRDEFRRDLRGTVKGVGPKTVDYLSILCGSTDHVAVDVQLRSFARGAGLTNATDPRIRQAVISAAQERGCSPGALDAAIWQYQQGR